MNDFNFLTLSHDRFAQYFLPCALHYKSAGANGAQSKTQTLIAMPKARLRIEATSHTVKRGIEGVQHFELCRVTPESREPLLSVRSAQLIRPRPYVIVDAVSFPDAMDGTQTRDIKFGTIGNTATQFAMYEHAMQYVCYYFHAAGQLGERPEDKRLPDAAQALMRQLMLPYEKLRLFIGPNLLPKDVRDRHDIRLTEADKERLGVLLPPLWKSADALLTQAKRARQPADFAAYEARRAKKLAAAMAGGATAGSARPSRPPAGGSADIVSLDKARRETLNLGSGI